MKIFFFTIFLSLLFGGVRQINAQTMRGADDLPEQPAVNRLRFEGLYCEDFVSDSRDCLRFYEDGTVLSAALGGAVLDEDLVKVGEWLTREPEKKSRYLSEGTYWLKDKKIEFSATVHYPDDVDEPRVVKIDFTGLIGASGAELILDSYSHYNGNRQKQRRYKFIKLDL